MGILLLLPIWFGLWCVFSGWGSLVLRIGRSPIRDVESLLLAPLLGVASVIVFLQVWHLFAPVVPWALPVVATIGLGASLSLNQWKWRLLLEIVRTHRMGAVLVGIVIVWLANRSLNSQIYNDHGLYYLNAIRWNAEYPVVLGLGNLHGRLAFNNSNFLLHAMLRIGPWQGYTAHLVNGFLCACTVPVVANGFAAVFQPGDPGRRQLGLFLIVPAMLVAIVATDHRISSANSDFVAALLGSFAVWRLLAIECIQGEAWGPKLRRNLMAFTILGAVAVTAKLTVVFLVFFAWLTMVWLVWRKAFSLDAGRHTNWRRSLIATVGGGAIIISPWLLTGYALSGYPLYPSGIGRAPVDWAVPLDKLEHERHIIRVYARTTHEFRELGSGHGLAWVVPWFWQGIVLRAPVQVLMPTGLAVVSAIAWWRTRKRQSRQSRSENKSARTTSVAKGMVVAYLLALVCWFLLAPSPRMGNFVCWGLAGTMLGLLSLRFSDEFFVRYRYGVAGTLVLLLIAPMAHGAVRLEIRHRFNSALPEYGLRAWDYYPFVWSQGESLLPAVPESTTEVRTTNSGLAVLVPTDGLPWDSELPAAPSLDSNLSLRGPGGIRDGFRIDTISQPTN